MNDWPEGERRGERAGPAHTASRRRNWIGSAVGPSDGLVEASAKGGFGRRTRFLNPRADRVETSDTGDYDG
jgi:hypothetical protein